MKNKKINKKLIKQFKQLLNLKHLFLKSEYIWFIRKNKVKYLNGL